MKRSAFEVGRSKVKVAEAEGRFGGLAEASFATLWLE